MIQVHTPSIPKYKLFCLFYIHRFAIYLDMSYVLCLDTNISIQTQNPNIYSKPTI